MTRRALPTSICRGKAERALVRWGILVCLALAFAGLPPALAAETAPNEAHVKAALVYNFAKFVEWPDDGNAAAGPLIVGVLGDPQLRAVIHETLRDKNVRGRAFEVRSFTAPENVALCHIVFVASSEKDSAQRAIHAARASPTLTIGQLRGFSDWGGVIELILEGNQFRFEINAGTARRGGLKMSSRLLRLARAVRGN